MKLSELSDKQLLDLRERLLLDASNYNKTQQAYKLVLNAGSYGVYASEFFYFANPCIASAITAQGRYSNKYAEREIIKYFTDIWVNDTELHLILRKEGFPLKDNVISIPNDKEYVNRLRVLMDTDSMHVSFYDFLKMNFDFDVDNDYELAREIMLSMYNNRLKDYVDGLMKDIAKDFNCYGSLVYEMENLHDKELILQKKMYISDSFYKFPNMFYEPGTHYKYTGVQLIRSDTSKYTRTEIKSLIERLIKNSNVYTINDVKHIILDLKKKFSSGSIQVTSKQIGLNNYKKYIQGESFEQKYVKGTPKQLKGALLHNLLLLKHNETYKYEFLKDGDKVMYYDIEPMIVNNMNFSCFAYNKDRLPSFAPPPKHDELFKKTVLDVLNKFIAVIWKEEITEENLNITRSILDI